MTTTEEIRRAIDVLTIQDVYLRECKATLAEQYEPKYSQGNATTNFGWGAKRAELAKIQDVTTNQELLIWKVHFYTRVRIFRSALDNVPADYAPKPEEILATIEATFVAEYQLKDPTVGPEALGAFSQHNVAYHIWPYWREHIMDVTSRMLLPRVTLPMHVFKAGGPTKSHEVSVSAKEADELPLTGAPK
jgi:hypothetical protein